MALQFTDQNFDEEVLKSDVPVLVDFWASWCGPCKMIGPIIDELAEKYEGKGVKIGKMNVDENPNIPGANGIMSIPTLLVFKGGTVAEQIVGAQPREKLEEIVTKYAGGNA